MQKKNISRKTRRTPAAQGEVLNSLINNVNTMSQRLVQTVQSVNLINEDLTKLLRLSPVNILSPGNVVVIDYFARLVNEDGTLGDTFAGGQMKGLVIRNLGNGELVKGFEDKLIGLEVGSTLEIDLTFPEDYHAHLAKKKVKFYVAVLESLVETPAGSYVDGFIEALNVEKAAKTAEKAEDKKV